MSASATQGGHKKRDWNEMICRSMTQSLSQLSYPPWMTFISGAYEACELSRGISFLSNVKVGQTTDQLLLNSLQQSKHSVFLYSGTADEWLIASDCIRTRRLEVLTWKALDCTDRPWITWIKTVLRSTTSHWLNQSAWLLRRQLTTSSAVQS